MKRRVPSNSRVKTTAWAMRLSQHVQSVLKAHPEADPDNVRHTLILLEQPPLERLQRSLTRGRATAIHRVSKLAANRAKDKLAIPVLRDALAVTQHVKRRARKKGKPA